MMPADLKRLHKYMLEVDIDHISGLTLSLPEWLRIARCVALGHIAWFEYF